MAAKTALLRYGTWQGAYLHKQSQVTQGTIYPALISLHLRLSTPNPIPPVETVSYNM
jgi:hypothetical protein